MPKWIQYFLLIISLTGYILIGYYIERSNFPQLISVYTSLFIIAYLIYKKGNPDNFRLFLISGILFRICLIFSIPALSDDFYRFVWDGRIQQLGFNPFEYTPAQIIKQHADPLLNKIFPYLNSPNYYSIYPQVCQSIFKIAAVIGGDSLNNTVTALKSAIFISELGTIFILNKLLSGKVNSKSLQLIYILNPLVIIELSGNIHFEALMIFFMLLAVLLIDKQHYISAAGALSLAIQAKLIPLIFVPLLIKKTGMKRTIFFALFCLSFTIIMSLILLHSTERFLHFTESLRLYYGKFEFNGSIYSLLKMISEWFIDYNPIALLSKIMMILALSGIFWIYIKKLELLNGMFWLLTVYLVFSAVVHPWYLTPLIALSAFVKHRFALIWSALVPLSYYTYSQNPYSENYWLTGLEYIIVFGFLIWDLKQLKSIKEG
jgi:hypothetical protein